MKFTPTEEKLKKKIKELTCLYEISKAISESNNVEEKTLKKIISSLKKAWNFEENAIVELQVLDYNLPTALIPGNSVSQISYINIKDFKTGIIKVHYPTEKYRLSDFSADEQKLLDNAAFEIGNYIEKYKNIETEALLRRKAERVDRLSLLGEMTAGITHELNTPLANILGFAELIKAQNKDSEIDLDITILINSVVYSREIVKKLMYFSSDMPQQFKSEEMKPLLTFALSFLKQNFQKKSIRNELIFKNDNIIAKIDSVQITQVLFNLYINAIYASPEKGTVKTIVESDNTNVFITIEDQGEGIPDAIKQAIFEPFFTTKPVSDGLGLGLSVVTRIIKNHNGEITVADNTPNGTIITIKLPIS